MLYNNDRYYLEYEVLCNLIIRVRIYKSTQETITIIVKIKKQASNSQAILYTYCVNSCSAFDNCAKEESLVLRSFDSTVVLNKSFPITYVSESY